MLVQMWSNLNAHALFVKSVDWYSSGKLPISTKAEHRSTRHPRNPSLEYLFNRNVYTFVKGHTAQYSLQPYS